MSEKSDGPAPSKNENPTGLALLRVPFPDHQISKLPKATKKQNDDLKADFKKGIRCNLCGGWHLPDVVHLDYVGHAALTDRLLDADPNWSWEPVSTDADGLPRFDKNGGLWIRLTVCGQTRLGYGNAEGKSGGDAVKEIIGDALRNAAMRFGAALDLWHKGELHPEEKPEEPKDAKPPAKGKAAPAPKDPPAKPAEKQGKMATPAEIKSLIASCEANQVSEADFRNLCAETIGRGNWKDLTAAELIQLKSALDKLISYRLATNGGRDEPPPPEDMPDPEPPFPPPGDEIPEDTLTPPKKEEPPPRPAPGDKASKKDLDALWDYGLKKGLKDKDLIAIVMQRVRKQDWYALTNFEAKAVRNVIDTWHDGKAVKP